MELPKVFFTADPLCHVCRNFVVAFAEIETLEINRSAPQVMISQGRWSKPCYDIEIAGRWQRGFSSSIVCISALSATGNCVRRIEPISCESRR
jgi:hypothetical protein